MAALQYEVFVTPAISPSGGTLNLPNGDPMVWSPIATTLIYGEQHAVLVDPPFTTDTTRELLTWVERSGRDITQIYTSRTGTVTTGSALPSCSNGFPASRSVPRPEPRPTWTRWLTPTPVGLSGTRFFRAGSRRPTSTCRS